MSSLGTGIVLHIVDPSLWSVHVDDSFREITFILRYILQCWFIGNLIVVACTGRQYDLNKLP